MPPSAARTRPALLPIAPVKAPLVCPNSSLSINDPTSDVASTARYVSLARGETSCKARATSSFPTPLSPVINTGEVSRLSFLMVRRTLWIWREQPRIP